MNKSFFPVSTALFLCAMKVFGTGSDGNLIRNPEFQPDAKGKPSFWSVRGGKIEEMIVEGSKKGKSAVKMPLVPAKSKAFKFGNVFSQAITRPAAGTYVISVNLSPSRKFVWTQIVLYYKDPETGKWVYLDGGRLKPEDYPKTGEWKKKCYTVTIPENVRSIGFAVELRDNEPDGFIKIENPTFILREE